MTAPHGSRFLAIAASVAMAAAVVAGIVVLGPPSHQRSLRLDERRGADLGMIRLRVQAYWQQHHLLPGSLDVPEMAKGNRRDPATGEPYEYTVTGHRTYRLCARFDLPSERMDQSSPVNFADHPAGRHCADQTIAEPEQ